MLDKNMDMEMSGRKNKVIINRYAYEKLIKITFMLLLEYVNFQFIWQRIP